MKFQKLLLDESLFDDEFDAKIDWVPTEGNFGSGTDNTIPFVTDYDDEFVDPEGVPSGIEDHVDAPVGPKEGSDTGVADILISAINDEWETIKKYNSLVSTLKAEAVNNQNYNSENLEFKIVVSKKEAYHQFCNSVAVRVIKRIAQEIVKQLLRA